MLKFGTISKQENKVNKSLNVKYNFEYKVKLDKLPSAVLCAWTAGIIDGEGHIRIAASKRLNDRGMHSFSVYILVGNTDYRMVKKLQDTWGGTITFEAKKGNRKDAYHWYATIRLTYKLLKAIKPYLVVKGEQAQLCLDLLESIFNNKRYNRYSPITDEEYKIRESLYKKMCILNKVGKEAGIAKALLLPDSVKSFGDIDNQTEVKI